VEAFVTTEAAFALRGDAGAGVLRCRREGRRVTFSHDAAAGVAPEGLVLRLHAIEVPATVVADGQVLRRVDRAPLDRADGGWAMEGEVVVVRTRGRRVEIG
jgi:hypothetical protein